MTGGLHNITGHAFVALATVAAGMVVTVSAHVFAATTDIAPWAQVGGTGLAVSALVYIAKLMADGKLVALPVADVIRRAEEVERKLIEINDDCKQREDALRALLFQRQGPRGHD